MMRNYDYGGSESCYGNEFRRNKGENKPKIGSYKQNRTFQVRNYQMKIYGNMSKQEVKTKEYWQRTRMAKNKNNNCIGNLEIFTVMCRIYNLLSVSFNTRQTLYK